MTKEEKIAEAYHRLGGNVTQVAKETGIPRTTVRDAIVRLKLNLKPIVGGKVKALQPMTTPLPEEGQVLRYIVTSAQNNTKVHQKFWDNLQAYAKHHSAKLMVATYSYNKGAYGQKSVKHGSEHKDRSTDIWLDPSIELHHLADQHIELAPGLVWCGEMNILPTAARPLSGFESYTGRSSGIFPHAKIAMESIASGKHEATKLNYTTGTITQRNYVQKKAGLKAEHHHCYGALIVEVDSDGKWFVRQLNADDGGTFYDLNKRVQDGKVSSGHAVEGINWGDWHCDQVDEIVRNLATDKKTGMLAVLKPRHQLIHDLCNFGPRNHHNIKDPHHRFRTFINDDYRQTDDVEQELRQCSWLLMQLQDAAPKSKMVVVDSNHDNAMERWLREADYRDDPKNAVYFLEMQLAKYKAIRRGDANFHLIEHALKDMSFTPKGTKFLRPDESFLLCGQVECGMHGHLGPNGSRGNPVALARISRKANTGHTHSAGIYDGLYVAGTSSLLDLFYNIGPSSWSHSHIITYPNGKRAIITMWGGKWRG